MRSLRLEWNRLQPPGRSRRGADDRILKRSFLSERGPADLRDADAVGGARPDSRLAEDPRDLRGVARPTLAPAALALPARIASIPAQPPTPAKRRSASDPDLRLVMLKLEPQLALHSEFLTYICRIFDQNRPVIYNLVGV